jgi:hypothetical protein
MSGQPKIENRSFDRSEVAVTGVASAVIQPPSHRSRPPALSWSERPSGKPNDTEVVHPGDSNRQRGEVTTLADTIIPPGKGRIVPCPDYNGDRGRDSLECHGMGSNIPVVPARCAVTPAETTSTAPTNAPAWPTALAAPTGGQPMTPVGAPKCCRLCRLT